MLAVLEQWFLNYQTTFIQKLFLEREKKPTLKKSYQITVELQLREYNVRKKITIRFLSGLPGRRRYNHNPRALVCLRKRN